LEDDEMTSAATMKTGSQSGVFFALLFALCATAATVLAAYVPETILNLWLEISISTTTALCNLFGVPVTIAGDIMTVNGFAMRVITQCTAMHYVIIISTAILLYTRHSFQYRLAGLLISTLLIIIANSLRLIVIGIIGSVSPDAFHIVHDYLWVAAFSLFVLGMWVLWAEQRFSLTRSAVMRGSVTLLICSTVYGVLLFAMPLYGKLMALITSPLFKMQIGGSQGVISFTGEKMLYSYPGGSFSASYTMDLMVIALYIGLILAAGDYCKQMIKKGISGLGVILCINAIVISVGGALAVRSGENAATLFLWIAHGLLLQLTLLTWILWRAPRKSLN
jgi:exosortase/archaeosortase family protein